ncbi:MAG: 16S rRNA (guanine(966)-N(2))-methyltransferase RsmD [Vigna little leaf phytoplasma]|nr:16S rRNA (guanine(966)-N(2))-methyltransferase RsmD [Vigna little leaf phytoplasma]
MLKIIKGKYKNIVLFRVPSKKTRSTSHLVRKALFDTIGSLHNMKVLDLFAGSGACAFEALSRNADMVYLVDNLFLAYRTMKQNKQKLNLTDQNVKIFYCDAFKILKKFIEEKLIFDLVILDPPYKENVCISLFPYLDMLTLSGSLVVYEAFYKKLLPSFVNSFFLFKNQKYGNKRLYFYQKKFFSF